MRLETRLDEHAIWFRIPMHSIILAAFFGTSGTVVSMCSAGILVSLIGVLAAKTDIAQAHGLNKVAALSNVCFAVPLAVFGALHLSGAELILPLVPKYMPGRLFWAYFFGCALLAASLSIATKIQVSWSGLLFGIMMFLVVAMLFIPAALAKPTNRLTWTLVARESSFAAGGWLLAGNALRQQGRVRLGSILITVGRIIIALGGGFFGIEHLLQPLNAPGVPLPKVLPVWIPGRPVIGYLTGTILAVGGVCILLGKKTRMVATYLGTWLLLLVLFLYGPLLIAALSNPK